MWREKVEADWLITKSLIHLLSTPLCGIRFQSLFHGEVLQLSFLSVRIYFLLLCCRNHIYRSAECLQSITHVIYKCLSITMVWSHPLMASIALLSPKSWISLLAYSFGLRIFTKDFCFFSLIWKCWFYFPKNGARKISLMISFKIAYYFVLSSESYVFPLTPGKCPPNSLILL